MVNWIIRECNKLIQKGYKTRHDWVEKVIHWELCEKLESDHTPYLVFRRGFEIQTDHLIPEDLVLINKKKRNCILQDFTVSADNRVKIKESEKINKYLDLPRELKKAVEHEGEDDTNCSWCTWNGPKRLEIKTEGTGNQRENREHTDHG